MKKQEFKFKVGTKEYKVKAVTAGDAMEYMNRNVMDQLNAHPFAWFDSLAPNSYYAASGNFFD
jgi:hypothetical protein